jgi:UrcA family protein
MTRKITYIIVAIAALTGTSAVAKHSIVDTDIPVRNVVYADLNLASPAGMAALHNRVNSAVLSVCGNADERDLRAMAAIHACRAKARDATQSQIALLTDRAQRLAIASVGPHIASR